MTWCREYTQRWARVQGEPSWDRHTINSSHACCLLTPFFTPFSMPQAQQQLYEQQLADAANAPLPDEDDDIAE